MSETVPTTAKPAGFDWISALMAVAASFLIAISGYGWLTGGQSGKSKAERPAVGSMAPPLRLIDPVTGEPVVLVGLQGKVVWVSFISTSSKTAQADYDALSQIWKRLRLHQKFAMAAVALPPADRDKVTRLIGGSAERLPTYIASESTASAFGVDPPHSPFHLILDPTGKVVAIGGEGMTSRLAKEATRWLDDIEPTGWTRFAFKH